MEDGVPSPCEPGLSGLSERRLSNRISADRKDIPRDITEFVHCTQHQTHPGGGR